MGRNRAKPSTRRITNSSRRKPVAQKSPSLKLILASPFLLVLLLLLKVGTVSRRTAGTVLKIISAYLLVAQPKTRRQAGKKILRLKHYHLPSLRQIYGKISHLTGFKKHPGRPRQKPLLPFYWSKFVRPTYRLIPKPTRLKIIGVLAIILLTGYSVFLSRILSQLPSPRELTTAPRPLTTQIYDRNGELLYQFYEGRNRKLVALQEIPLQMIQATIAIEDRHFFTHPGIDIEGVIRALKTNLGEGKLEGGSTITQQLIKNTLLTPDQTLTRKIKEAILAFWAERVYSKQDILQMYFNEVPYGGPAWGVEAASEMYFGKKVSDLDLAESAYLAGLPAAPTFYSPYGTQPQMGKQRQMEVLRRMVEEKYITDKQAQQAETEPLNFSPNIIGIKAPHFVMYVRSLLAEKYGQRMVAEGGLRVTTTLDLGLQEMAQSVVAEQIAELANLQVGNGAAMVTDPKTGQILAMVGSKDYFDPAGGNYNAALALRQPGSSIKPVTYAEAFKEGYSPGTSLLDAPTNFPNAWGQGYAPVNYDGRFHGIVSIRTALGSSYNIPAVKMLAEVGVPKMAATARQMGITTFTNPDSYGLSLTLGGAAVKMIDMMSVYGTLASGGIRFTPDPILTVTDSDGNVLEDHRQPSGQRVLTEEVAYMLSNILSDDNARAPAFGKNSLLAIPQHTVAVKTGTSDEKRDNWTFGYTPNYVVGVWVGNNDNSPMNQALTSGITGAAPIWHDIMDNLLRDKPDIAFARPAGIIEGVVDGHKDLVIGYQMVRQRLQATPFKQKESAGKKDAITYTGLFPVFTPGTDKATSN